MDKDKRFYSFEGQAGRTAVVILGGSLPPSSVRATLHALGDHADVFSSLSTDVLLMVDGENASALAHDDTPIAGVKVIYCLKDYFERCGFDEKGPWAFIIDRNQRIMAQFNPAATSDWLAAAVACLTTVPTEEARFIALPAPVLSVPNIFGTAFCRTLIAHFENGSPTPGVIASVDPFGNPIQKIDADNKRRQDCILQRGSPIHSQVAEALARRCVPEMKKAYQFDASHTDRILIARYDDTGGFFKRHRDNVAASVAFRQFALSVNLNAGEYEGGHLSFPEYNNHSYRPDSGAGIIFSASLLHEAMPVTKGRRYVLLTFFHNDEAEAMRLAGLAPATMQAA
ncbi:2OG-Fe(II) oxygenase [Beijerinckia sp. L45]|uniref:2OG-Fe(II) oxygenase n=1 Tax=Beijerinckia sp. L45 TaxID=1641855 RepID=UPI00131DEBF0|nr:2OG-Fe(II) oxygenase [Beijerinckia sp. L45]